MYDNNDNIVGWVILVGLIIGLWLLFAPAPAIELGCPGRCDAHSYTQGGF